MKWKKLGKIFDPTDYKLINNCVEFAQSPQALIFDDFVRIYFSTREKDHTGKHLSHIAFVDFDKKFKKIINISSDTVIALGNLGCFTQEGLTKWETIVGIVGTGAIVDYVGEHTFEELTSGDTVVLNPREEIRKKMDSPQFNKQILNFGTTLVWFDVGNIVLSEEYNNSPMLNEWQADLANKIESTKIDREKRVKDYQEQGEAEGKAEVLQGLATAIQDLDLSEETMADNRDTIYERIEKYFREEKKRSDFI